MNPLVKQLAGRRMFVLAKLFPRESGKVDKIPVNAQGQPIDGQDPQHWLTPEVAFAEAARLGLGVGIVFYEGCGLFFVDVDHAYENGAWSILAHEAIATFPGAYVEVSQSGTGLHVIGSCMPVPPHSVKNTEFGLETYTRKRFCFLGTYQYGDANADLTSQLVAWLGAYFAPAAAEREEYWTEEAVGGNPIADDSALVQRAINMRPSPGAAFGTKATFRELWEGGAKLQQSFPPQNGHDDFDRSSADMSLASWLAFLTGSNCERSKRIFLQCPGLAREKWARDDYVDATISKACQQCTRWYDATPATAQPPIAAAPTSIASAGTAPSDSQGAPPPPPPAPISVDTSLGITTLTVQTELFAGWTYVRDMDRVQLGDGTVVKKEQLDHYEGGRAYVIDDQGKTTNSTFDAFVSNQLFRFPRVLTQYFDPRDALGTIRTFEGQTEINCYRPIETPCIEGNPEPFLNLVKRMLPNGRDAEILLCYLAACIQNPGIKFMWCPYVQGVKGNGKTTLAQIMEHCLSLTYTHGAKATEIGEKFNSVLVNKLFVYIDEVKGTDKRDLEETLKPLITSTRIETRPMYAEKVMKAICFNMMILSNYKDGIRIDADERRYAPLYCAQQHKEDLDRDGMTKKYFRAFYDWLRKEDGFAIVNHYLRNLVLPDELNPATECTRAPETTSTASAFLESLGPIEQEVHAMIECGAPGFRGGWGSSIAFDFALNAAGRGKGLSRAVRAQVWDTLGYIPHPSLPGGAIQGDGFADAALGARIIYIKRDHPQARRDMIPAEVREGYVAAQAGVPAPPKG